MMKGRLATWACAAAVFLAAFLSHAPALRNDFVGDDFRLIVGNEFTAKTSNILHLFQLSYVMHQPVTSAARPLTLASLMIDRGLWGLRPACLRMGNLLLHGLNSTLVFLLVAGLAGIEGWALPGALFAGLLFALHPVQVEAVDLIAYRADPLCAFFYLSGLLCFLHRRRWLALACLVLALLAKEIAVTLPAVVALYAWLYRNEKGWVLVRRALWVVGAAAATGVYLLLWTDRLNYHWFNTYYCNIAGGICPLSSCSAYLNTLMLSTLYNARSILAPLRLSVEPQIALPPTLLHASTALFLALAAALATAWWRCKDRLFRFGLGFFLLTYLPVCNAIPLLNTVANRYLYLPLAGLCLAAAFLINSACALDFSKWSVRPGRWVPVLAAALLVFFCGSETLKGNRRFKDHITLYGPGSNASLGSPRTRYHLGVGYIEHDEPAEALVQFEAAIRLAPLPQRVWIWHLMGTCYEKLGDRNSAKKYYLKAIATAGRKETFLRLANLLVYEGNLHGAIRALEQSLARSEDPVTCNNLGFLHAYQKHYAEAIMFYQRALELDSGYRDAWVNLIRARRDAGDAAGASLAERSMQAALGREKERL